MARKASGNARSYYSPTKEAWEGKWAPPSYTPCELLALFVDFHFRALELVQLLPDGSLNGEKWGEGALSVQI